MYRREHDINPWPVLKEVATTPLAPINFARHLPEILERVGFGPRTDLMSILVARGVGGVVILGPMLEGYKNLKFEGSLEAAAIGVGGTWIIESLLIKIMRLDRRPRPRHLDI